MSNQSKQPRPRRILLVEKLLFNSRWLLLPFSLVLLLSLVVFAIVDIKEFIHYLEMIPTLSKETATLVFIEMVDLYLIAALGKMIITGGYNSFISKKHGYEDENIGSGLLKVKLATSLIGVTSIALLDKSIKIALIKDTASAEYVSWDELYKLGFIHALFLTGAIILSFSDWIHAKIKGDVH